MYDAMVGIEIDQVRGEEDTQTVHSLRRDHPNPLIWLQSNSSNEASEPGEMRIRDSHIEAQEGLARLIEHAIGFFRLVIRDCQLFVYRSV